MIFSVSKKVASFSPINFGGSKAPKKRFRELFSFPVKLEPGHYDGIQHENLKLIDIRLKSNKNLIEIAESGTDTCINKRKKFVFS